VVIVHAKILLDEWNDVHKFITEQHWKQRGLKNGVLRGGDSGDN
jgi:hypothetical protein